MHACARACIHVCVHVYMCVHPHVCLLTTWLLPLPSTPMDSPITFCPSYVWEPTYKDNKESRTGSRTKTRPGPQETKRQERSGATCSGDISTVSGSEHHNWDPRSTTQQLRDVTSLGHSSLTMKGLKTILATGESL